MRYGDIGHTLKVCSAAVGRTCCQIDALEAMTQAMATEAAGQRYVDLALNAIELIDRNLYERTCDVRWWATDSALVDALHDPAPEQRSFASSRLAVILAAYTVYLDLWLCDVDGQIVAKGGPTASEFRAALWLTNAGSAKRWRSQVEMISRLLMWRRTVCCKAPASQPTQPQSAREEPPNGRPLGVLGIHFDWEPQARAIVDGVRLSPEEAKVSRVMLVDARKRVIAASDGCGILLGDAGAGDVWPG